jgi:hypothetical protein
MRTHTQEHVMQITATILASLSPEQIAALPAHTVIVPDAQVSAPVDLAAPALEVPAQDAPTEETLPTLTRGAWKALRTTKAGKVRKAFAGMTREQAFEAGLCPGYRLPTGDMRAALRG